MNTKSNLNTTDNNEPNTKRRFGATLASLGVISLLLGIVFYSGVLYALIDNVIAQVRELFLSLPYFTKIFHIFFFSVSFSNL